MWTKEKVYIFLSTPSARRATLRDALRDAARDDFYPRPLRGGRPHSSGPQPSPWLISIHALCEEGDADADETPEMKAISIHALCEEGDLQIALQMLERLPDFYPRPLRGGRPALTDGRSGAGKFLSTPSARRATDSTTYMMSVVKFLSTPSARRATRSICSLWMTSERFLSTPSARRATWLIERKIEQHENFYPRPLRGGRRSLATGSNGLSTFLSTPSARRATVTMAAPKHPQRISIHALCEEGDGLPMRFHCTQSNFYPRPLRGGRPEYSESNAGAKEFLSTPSARRATSAAVDAHNGAEFLSTPSARRATTDRYAVSETAKFLSTPSARRATAAHTAAGTASHNFYPRPLRGGRRG